MSGNADQDSGSGRSTIRAALITAAAMLISAPIGALIGRATAPLTVSAPATKTVTVTAEPSAEVGPASDTDVFWQGELVWGSYDLDTNPPTKDPGYANGFQNGSDSTGAFLRTDGDVVLTIVRESDAPSEESCRAAVADGGSATGTLTRNDYVCGRTSDGRLFRIHILGAGQAEVSGQVTVWPVGDTP